MRYIDQIVGSQRLRTVSGIGETIPLTTTTNGKAALACLDEPVAKELVLEELPAHPEFGIKLSPLLNELSRIRAGALAIDQNDYTDGICGLGFAVSGPTGDVFAISVPAPSSRFVLIKDKLASLLLHAPNEFS